MVKSWFSLTKATQNLMLQSRVSDVILCQRRKRSYTNEQWCRRRRGGPLVEKDIITIIGLAEFNETRSTKMKDAAALLNDMSYAGKIQQCTCVFFYVALWCYLQEIVVAVDDRNPIRFLIFVLLSAEYNKWIRKKIPNQISRNF